MSERKLPMPVLVGAVWVAALVAFFGTIWLGPHVIQGSVEARLLVGTVTGLIALGVSLGIPLLYYRFRGSGSPSLPKL